MQRLGSGKRRPLGRPFPGCDAVCLHSRTLARAVAVTGLCSGSLRARGTCCMIRHSGFFPREDLLNAYIQRTCPCGRGVAASMAGALSGSEDPSAARSWYAFSRLVPGHNSPTGEPWITVYAFFGPHARKSRCGISCLWGVIPSAFWPSPRPSPGYPGGCIERRRRVLKASVTFIQVRRNASSCTAKARCSCHARLSPPADKPCIWS